MPFRGWYRAVPVTPISGWWLLRYVVLLHSVWGICLILFPEVANTTPLHMLVTLCGGDSVITGLILLVVAGCSLVGLHGPRTWSPLARFAVLLPQQFILVISSFGAAQAIWRSQYADLVPRPMAFIFADQFPVILVTIIHAFVLVSITWQLHQESSTQKGRH